MPYLHTHFEYKSLLCFDSEIQRQQALDERKAWVLTNQKNLETGKFTVLLAVILYAQNHLIKTEAHVAPNRFDIFNAIFETANLNRKELDFYNFILKQRDSIKHVLSSMEDALSTAEIYRNHLLSPYRKTFDYATLSALAYYMFETTPLSVIPAAAMIATYYSLRENAIDYAYKKLAPAGKYLDPLYKNVAKPLGGLLIKGPSLLMHSNLFQSCRKHKHQDDENDPENNAHLKLA